MIYSVVDSVKGGSGKTAFSIFLGLHDTTLTTSKTSIEKIEEKDKNKACIIDVDMLGTAIDSILYDSDMRYEHFTVEDKGIYFNEIIGGCCKKNYITKTKIEYSTSDGDDQERELSFIVSSPQQSEKNKFMVSTTNGCLVEVEYNTFQSALSNIIKDMKELKIDNKDKYNHIIFDMPPNSDGYAEQVFDCLLHKGSKIYKKGKDTTRLYLVGTLDKAHISANTSWLLDSVVHHEKWRSFDEIYIIINDNMGTFTQQYENEPFRNHCFQAMSEYRKHLKDKKICLGASAYKFILVPRWRNYLFSRSSLFIDPMHSNFSRPWVDNATAFLYDNVIEIQE